MLDYLKDVLHKFHQPAPTRPQHYPHQWTAPNFGSISHQLEHPNEDSPELNPEESNNVKKAVGTFLQYARAVNPIMLVTMNSIAYQQAKSNQATAKKVVQLINYESTHQESITLYHTSGMILHMHRDAYFIYLQESNRRSRGYHYLSAPSKSELPKLPTYPLHSTYPYTWK